MRKCVITTNGDFAIVPHDAQLQMYDQAELRHHLNWLKSKKVGKDFGVTWLFTNFASVNTKGCLAHAVGRKRKVMAGKAEIILL